MPVSPRLSLCMIVRNEAHFLGRCLDAVRDHVDEIIVVDTGSTDQTRAIAARYTERIYDFEWVDDFSLARNYSLEQASGDWILVLDADELMEEKDLRTLRQLICDTADDAFLFVRRDYSNNPLEAKWTPVQEQTPYTLGYAGYREEPISRLFRNREDIRFQGRVHEIIDGTLQQGKFSMLDIVLHHHIDADPTKPNRDRQLRYLEMMEEELRQRSDGSLHKTAASVCMYYKEDYHRAIEHYRAAIEQDYYKNECREGIAEAHYRLNELQEAYTRYLELFECGYRSFTLCNNLANLMARNGQYARAAQLLQMSLTLAELDGETSERIRHNIGFLQSKADS